VGLIVSVIFFYYTLILVVRVEATSCFYRFVWIQVETKSLVEIVDSLFRNSCRDRIGETFNFDFRNKLLLSILFVVDYDNIPLFF
jgi:hypothetical protein